MGEDKAEEKGAKKATSIKIDQELWKEAKIEAIRRGVELSELVEKALRKEIGVKSG
jgi:predicted HicB family RNase H-like nuclease